MLSELPIFPFLPSIAEALDRTSQVLIVAEPGAGKTTAVPITLLKRSCPKGKKILLLEPRRVAALGAAERMSELLGAPVGDLVGYRTRGASKVSNATVLEVITEGILTRMLLDDPALASYAVVIFDEYHERSIHSDVGLALCLQSQQILNPSLKIVVMSATLEIERLKNLLPKSELVVAPGRSFPVGVTYTLPDRTLSLEQNVAAVVRKTVADDSGDILVFLPGAKEIRRTRDALLSFSQNKTVEILTFYGETPIHEQRQVLHRGKQERPRVILATNIAETSVTIEGISTVIDSGLMRVAQTDLARGMSKLVTIRVSQASAAQRAGRAGRLGPGRCVRLWSEAEHRALRPFNEPEILQADLTSLLRDLAAWGVGDIKELAFLDYPSPTAMAAAHDTLRKIGALNPQGILTELGKGLSELGVHPRLGAMILRGVARGLGGDACTIAAILEEKDLLQGSERDVDLGSRWQLLKDAANKSARGSRQAGFASERLNRVLRSSEQLKEKVRHRGTIESETESGQRLGFLVALAYPDRIAKRRAETSGTYLLSNGIGAELPPGSLLGRHEYLAVAQVDQGAGRNARIGLAEPLASADIEELAAEFSEVSCVTEWDSRTESVREIEETAIGKVILGRAVRQASEATAIEILCRQVRERGVELLPWTKDARSLQSRVNWLNERKHLQEALPTLSNDWLMANANQWLGGFLQGSRSLKDLQKLDLHQILLSLFSFEEKKQIDALAPAHWVLPTGTKAAITYDTEPTISVLLQEMFGAKETPRIAGGAIPLTIELLSPAKRPLQVTRDLASFWSATYPKIRSEMKAKYPRHFWPENPLESEPQRGARKRGVNSSNHR